MKHSKKRKYDSCRSDFEACKERAFSSQPAYLAMGNRKGKRVEFKTETFRTASMKKKAAKASFEIKQLSLLFTFA